MARDPGKIEGTYGTASMFGSLDGWTLLIKSTSSIYSRGRLFVLTRGTSFRD